MLLAVKLFEVEVYPCKGAYLRMYQYKKGDE
jgi:hypothetical protein